jgi:hypothetical protein
MAATKSTRTSADATFTAEERAAMKERAKS